jgi:hypothetical protein
VCVQNPVVSHQRDLLESRRAGAIKAVATKRRNREAADTMARALHDESSAVPEPTEERIEAQVDALHVSAKTGRANMCASAAEPSVREHAHAKRSKGEVGCSLWGAMEAVAAPRPSNKRQVKRSSKY